MDSSMVIAHMLPASSFHRFDHGYKAYLDREEFECALVACFGFSFAKNDLDILFEKCLDGPVNPITRSDPADESYIVPGVAPKRYEGVTLAQFTDIVERRSHVLENFDESYRKFSAISEGNRGFLTRNDILALFIENGLPELMANDAFSVMDADKDGRVSFGDFKRFMQTSASPNPLPASVSRGVPRTLNDAGE